MKNNELLKLFGIGFAMGSADIVPGVSGGTIAFVSGIYEKLITSVRNLSTQTLPFLLKGKLSKAISSIPFTFFVPLAAGLFSAILLLSRVLEYLLNEYPVFIWSFFFGLIIASTLIVRRAVKEWTLRTYIMLAVGTIAAFVIVGAVPVETPATYLAFFLSGAIAIMAMILPGISGSFLLVIMGKYQQILSAVTSGDFITLAFVLLGAILGLGVFSHVLSWMFKRYHDITIAMLTGFMIGSLRKVWPWKETIEFYKDSHGEMIPLVQKIVLPPLTSDTFIALCICIAGAAIVLYLERFNISKNE